MIVVIPCFNEAERLAPAHVEALLSEPRVRVIFVDDGSTDRTPEVLADFVARSNGRAEVLTMRPNGGKAEAVRAGLNRALGLGDRFLGYADADFSTPPTEVVRLADELDASGAVVALGSRVARLGAHIERSAARHYLGRVYATVASIVLDLAVYDTQCGAKMFRDTSALRHALSVPFSSRWSFDVELIGRLCAGADGVPPIDPEQMIEVPLRAWVDVAGSKLNPRSAIKAGLDLIALGGRVARRGKAGFFPR